MKKKEEVLTNVSSSTRYGYDERNFAEWPICYLSTKAPPVKTFKLRDPIRVNGQRIDRQVTVTSTDEYGLPYGTDEDVLLALKKIAGDRGFDSQVLHFSRKQVIDILGWADNGSSWRRIKDALNRFAGVRLIFEKSFYIDKANQTKNIGIIESFALTERGPTASSDHGFVGETYIKWSDELFQSFRSENHSLLDLDIYFSLRTIAAKRLFRFINKRTSRSNPKLHGIKVSVLAFEHLGFPKDTSVRPAVVRQRVNKAIDELVDAGILSPTTRYQGPRSDPDVLLFRVFDEQPKGRKTILVTDDTQKSQVQPSKVLSLARDFRTDSQTRAKFLEYYASLSSGKKAQIREEALAQQPTGMRKVLQSLSKANREGMIEGFMFDIWCKTQAGRPSVVDVIELEAVHEL